VRPTGKDRGKDIDVAKRQTSQVFLDIFSYFVGGGLALPHIGSRDGLDQRSTEESRTGLADRSWSSGLAGKPAPSLAGQPRPGLESRAH